MKLVLDVGSGASLPDAGTARRMVDEIKGVDSGKHKIVLKAQCFLDAPPNVPLGPYVFDALYGYGKTAGYDVTASVFDKVSLNFLLRHNPCFVKIACRPELYWLAGEVPRRVPVYISVVKDPHDREENGEWLACVPKYPASIIDYQLAFRGVECVSDHTVGWDMYRVFNKHGRMRVWECHVKLDDTTGPDAGPWARSMAELKEIM